MYQPIMDRMSVCVCVLCVVFARVCLFNKQKQGKSSVSPFMATTSIHHASIYKVYPNLTLLFASAAATYLVKSIVR